MQRLEVSGAVRPVYGSLGVKRLIDFSIADLFWQLFWSKFFRYSGSDKLMCVCVCTSAVAAAESFM